MKILAFLLRAFQHFFVLYGFSALIFWISYGVMYRHLDSDLVTSGKSIINVINTIWVHHLDYPLIYLVDFFAIVYLVHYVIKNE